MGPKKQAITFIEENHPLIQIEKYYSKGMCRKHVDMLIITQTLGH